MYLLHVCFFGICIYTQTCWLDEVHELNISRVTIASTTAKLVELNAKLKFKKEAKEKHVWVEEAIIWDLGEAKSNLLTTKESIEELENKNIALENNNVASFVLSYKASWRIK